MVTVLIVAGLCMFALVEAAHRSERPPAPMTLDLTNLLRRKR